MNIFIEVSIEVDSELVREILIAEMTDLSFYGFEETDSLLKAYVLKDNYDEEGLNKILNRYNLKHSLSQVEERNWNDEWERGFTPVAVDNFCLIRADFHPAIPGFSHEVIITPKMSFGTGHHATTYMMVQQMKELSFYNRSVADFGTGTGILAIMAEKLGSNEIQAFDNDDWSITNAAENIARNDCRSIKLVKADSFRDLGPFDIILANINRNVILQNFDGLVFGLKRNGFLLLSGFLPEDENEIVKVSGQHNLRVRNTVERDNWISILLQR